MSNIVKLFSYDNRVDLMYLDNQIRSRVMTSNSPFNERTIKLHKGVDNQIRFRVLNPDRKRVSVDHLSIRVRLINPNNGELVLERYANLTTTKGEVRLVVYEGDLTSIAPGYYNLVVVGQEPLVPQQTDGVDVNNPFYINTGGDVVAVAEVVESAEIVPQPTTTILPDDWTRWSSDRGAMIEYYSSAIPGERLKNHLHSLHTFAVYTTGFTGTLEVKGSLDIQPPAVHYDFFPIDITSGTQKIEFENFTGITSHSFEANFLWLRFVYQPDTSLPEDSRGTIDQVLVR